MLTFNINVNKVKTLSQKFINTWEWLVALSAHTLSSINTVAHKLGFPDPIPLLCYAQLLTQTPRPSYYAIILFKYFISNPNQSWKILLTLDIQPNPPKGPTLCQTMDVIYEWTATGIGIAFDWKIWILNIRNNN
jgi:hypothetical protein